MSHFLRLLIESVASINSNFQSQGWSMMSQGWSMMPQGWEHSIPKVGTFQSQAGTFCCLVRQQILHSQLTARPQQGYGLPSSIRNLLSSEKSHLSRYILILLYVLVFHCSTLYVITNSQMCDHVNFSDSENSGTLNRTCASFLYFVCHILAQSEKPVETGY